MEMLDPFFVANSFVAIFTHYYVVFGAIFTSHFSLPFFKLKTHYCTQALILLAFCCNLCAAISF
jgi:hypothetical protein